MGRTSTDFVVAMVIAVSAREGNAADRAKDLLLAPQKAVRFSAFPTAGAIV
jgi:hypothetical protein